MWAHFARGKPSLVVDYVVPSLVLVWDWEDLLAVLRLVRGLAPYGRIRQLISESCEQLAFVYHSLFRSRLFRL